MNSSPNRCAKKIGALEWLLIVYVLVGLALAGVCLTFDGEARFGAFSAYSLYATPLFHILSMTGLGERLFAEWPHAVFWTAGSVVVNGFLFYAFVSLITLRRRRRPKPLLADTTK